MKKEEPWSDDSLGPSTRCKICNNSFSSRGDFSEHLALDHFRPQLEHSLGRLPTCPSCSLYRAKDPAQLLTLDPRKLDTAHIRKAVNMEACEQAFAFIDRITYDTGGADIKAGGVMAGMSRLDDTILVVGKNAFFFLQKPLALTKSDVQTISRNNHSLPQHRTTSINPTLPFENGKF